MIKAIVALVVLGAIPCLMIAGVIHALRQRKRDKDALHKRVHDAIEKITEDGVVEGPKGKYVPHRSWGVGLGSATSRETKAPDHAGPYGMPKPR